MRHSESTCGTVCARSGCNPERNLTHASPSTVSNLARIKRATGREISAVSKRRDREVPVVANTLGWQRTGSQRSQFRVGGTLRNPEHRDSQLTSSTAEQGTLGNELHHKLELHLTQPERLNTCGLGCPCVCHSSGKQASWTGCLRLDGCGENTQHVN